MQVILESSPMKDNLLFSAPGAQVDHGLPELLLADASVIVVVKHLESSSDIIHLVAASLDNLKTNAKKVLLRHLPIPLAVSLNLVLIITILKYVLTFITISTI